jgi:hypothetical protein
VRVFVSDPNLVCTAYVPSSGTKSPGWYIFLIVLAILFMVRVDCVDQKIDPRPKNMYLFMTLDNIFEGVFATYLNLLYLKGSSLVSLLLS